MANSCDATEKYIDEYWSYWGGATECGMLSEIINTYSSANWHEDVDEITFTGKIWTIGEWNDDETIKIEIMDSIGTVL